MRRCDWFRVQLVQTIILESSHIYTTIVVGRFTIGQRGIACCCYTTGTAPAALHSVTDCEQLASLLSIWQFPTTSPAPTSPSSSLISNFQKPPRDQHSHPPTSTPNPLSFGIVINIFYAVPRHGLWLPTEKTYPAKR